MSLFFAAAVLAASAPSPDPVDRWAPEIAEASSRFHLPRSWIRRVIRAESGGRTRIGGRAVVSSAGAMGLMQLMPGTWLEVRSLLGLGDDAQDPRDNILAGTFYLRQMYDRFGYPGLFAAYNAGPKRYSVYLAGAQRLPAETRIYTERIARDDEDGARMLRDRSDAAISRGRSASFGAASADGLFVELEAAPAHRGMKGGEGLRPLQHTGDDCDGAFADEC
jgi:soluble lytic murein transglycosylase-like protein